MEKLKDVIVYSTVEDKGIKRNLQDSPMWKKSIHPDDLENDRRPGIPMYKYSFKFDGLKPVQVNSVKKISN